MHIGFSKGWGISFIVLGGVNVALGLLTASVVAFSGAIIGLVGVMYLLGHGWEVDDNQIRIRNALGMTLKSLDFGSLADVRIEGKTVYVTTSAGEKKVGGLGGMLTDKSDFEKLRARVAKAHGD